MSGRHRSRIVHEDERMTITRFGSGGKKNPSKVKVEMHGVREGTETDGKYRTLSLGIEELFDLTEVLDDLCDSIEDNG